jgi:hypothetical protein
VRRPRPRPLLLVIAVSALVLGACGGDGELGGPNLGGSLAASIGSFEYTNADLEDEVEQWASNPDFLAQALQISEIGEADRRPSQLVAFVLYHRVLSERGRQLAEDAGFTPTAEQIEGLIQEVDGAVPDPATGEPLFRRYSDEFRRQLARDFAYQSQLDPASPAPKIAINPRYGDYVEDGSGLGQVVPPTGPRPAPFIGQ